MVNFKWIKNGTTKPWITKVLLSGLPIVLTHFIPWLSCCCLYHQLHQYHPQNFLKEVAQNMPLGQPHSAKRGGKHIHDFSHWKFKNHHKINKTRCLIAKHNQECKGKYAHWGSVNTVANGTKHLCKPIFLFLFCFQGNMHRSHPASRAYKWRKKQLKQATGRAMKVSMKEYRCIFDWIGCLDPGETQFATENTRRHQNKFLLD